MSRTHSLLLSFVALALALGGCSAITDFDRAKIAEANKRDSGMDADIIDEDEAGDEELDGGDDEGGDEPGGCEPGTAGDECAPCEPGTFCAGGKAAKLGCEEGTVDHDLNAASPCVEQRTCSPGEFVSGTGSPTTDRSCAPCAAGRFSDDKNAPACDGWTTCLPGEYVVADGAMDHNQECAPCQAGYFSDSPNSGKCVPYGSCPAGTKRVNPALAGPCTTCMAGEYCEGEDNLPVACASGSWDHDSSPASRCANWTNCGSGMYVSTTGSATVDRVCSNCAAGNFSSAANATTCAPWSNCAAGSYVSRQGNAAQDRTCTACGAGTFNAALNATMCTTWRTCAAGTFVGTAGTLMADRVCTACATGQFSLGNSAATCTAWTACPAGQYISTAGSAMANQVCMTCPTGTYSAAPNTSACTPAGQCAAGTRQTAPATGTTPAMCAACVAGQYCAGGPAAVVTCGSGNWDHDASPATTCQPWIECAQGSYVSNTPNATTNRVCTACATGTFSSNTVAATAMNHAPNAARCLAWTDCVAGRFIRTTGSNLVDQVCQDCPSGTFTSAANQSSCATQRTCVAGEYVIPPAASPTTNRSCQTCGPSTFTSGSVAANAVNRAPNAAMCLGWSNCPIGTYVQGAPNEAADRQCTTCPTGFNSDAINQSRCLSPNDCPVGTRDTPGAMPPDPNAVPPRPRACTPCVAGWYCPGGGPGQACGTGNWDSNQTVFTDPCATWATCTAGSQILQPPGAPAVPAADATHNRTCAACNGSSNYQNQANQTSCIPQPDCTAGQRQIATPTPSTNRGCGACPGGQFSGSPNNTESCAQCPIGSVAPAPASGASTGAIACTTCTNSYAPTTGLLTCTPYTMCSTGSEATGGSSTTDVTCRCGPGYSLASGSCGPCATGFNPLGSYNALMCMPWTECTAGSQYQTSSGTPTADRSCANCATCPAGQGASGCSGTTLRTCTACSAGQFSGGGAAACEACTGNSISGAGASGCTPCGAAATAIAGNTACACDSGNYGNPPTTACTAYAANCPAPAQFEATPRSATADRTCGMCNPGTMTTADNQPGIGSCVMTPVPPDPDAGM